MKQTKVYSATVQHPAHMKAGKVRSTFLKIVHEFFPRMTSPEAVIRYNELHNTNNHTI